jgi:hypothetical protein
VLELVSREPTNVDDILAGSAFGDRYAAAGIGVSGRERADWQGLSDGLLRK